MDVPGDSAADAAQVNASDERGANAVGAERTLSVDYLPIIEDAVAGLADNTPDARSEVYAQACGVVERRLQLMRLPDPVVELEKLALDLTIEKIERGWQAREAAEEAIPQDAPEHGTERNTAANASGPLAGAIVPGLRPRMTTISRVARLLRPLARPVGIAAVLSAVATIFFGFYGDNNVNYRKLVDSPIGRWVSRLDPQPGTAHVSADAGRVAADGGSSRANPIDSVFAELPDAPTTTISACGSGPSISERNACARESSGEGTESGGSIEAETPKSDTDPPWLASFAALMDFIAGQPPSTDPPMAAGDVPARATVPYGALEADQAARGISPDIALGTTVPPQEPSTPLIKPVNPKVMALIESGKRAALKGDLDRAVRDFGEAIRIDPTYPDSYAERGQTLFRLGEVERAIADYSAALARDPQHGVALRARGMAYLYGGKTDVALADLSKTIELAEHDPRLVTPIELFYARRSRSSVYDSKQQYDLEIADCTALIESYTHDPSLVEALTANYGSAGSANVLATIYRQRANAFIRRSNWERAVADLTEAIPLSSDRGYTALIDRSKVQEGLGRYSLAAADARAALEIRPGSEEARLMLDRVGAAAKPTSPKRL